MVRSIAEEKLHLLIRASSELIASEDLGELLRRVLRLSRELIAADAYALWSFDVVAERWDVVSADGLSAAYLDSATIVMTGTTPGMHATISARDVFEEPLLQGRWDAYRAEGIRSVLIVPLRIAGKDHGTLAFYYRRPHEPRSDDVAIAESLASLASAAINSFRLHEQQRLANVALNVANRRLTVLSEAAALLSEPLSDADEDGESGSIESTDAAEGDSLARLAELLVPAIGDVCVLDLFERDGRTRRLNVAVAGGVRRDVLDAVHIRSWRTSPGSPETFGDAIAKGRPVLVAAIDDAWLAACAASRKQRDLARRLGLSSLLIAPLKARGAVIGAFSLASTTRRYTPEDLQLLDGLARRTAATIDNQRLLQETQQVAAELRRANAAKDEFLGLVSHELRTPLTTIRGNAQVLARHRSALEEESVDVALTDIANESERLHRIVENLLLLARFEQGKLIDREPLLVVAVVEQIVLRHRRSAPGRRFEIVASSKPRPVSFPEGYLELIVENLITNAEKYSAPDTPITIEIERSDGEVRLRVLDEGIGIDEAEAAQIFEAFYRSESASGLAGGIGIGLTVCRRVVEAGGGEIWARKRPGGGSEFGFSLPIPEEEIDSLE